MIDKDSPRRKGDVQLGDRVKWRGDGRTGVVDSRLGDRCLVDFGYRQDWCHVNHLTVVQTWQSQTSGPIDDWFQDELPLESDQL